MTAPETSRKEPSRDDSRDPSRVEGKQVVRIGLAVMVTALVVFCSSFFFCGRKRFVTGSEMAEAHLLIDALGKGLVKCAKDEGLPVTTSQVPAKLSEISGGNAYQPKEHDFDDPAFECAQFKNLAPQHFQIQWERKRPDHGRVHAYADLDGNGQVDLVIFAEITCNPDDLRECTMGPISP